MNVMRAAAGSQARQRAMCSGGEDHVGRLRWTGVILADMNAPTSSPTVRHIGGLRTLVFSDTGPILATGQDTNDLISAAWEHEAEWLVLPAARVHPDFFRLETRIAGELIQKFVNYRLHCAVVGDISAHLAASKSLRDFAYETNRGRVFWLLDDAAAFEARLAPAAA